MQTLHVLTEVIAHPIVVSSHVYVLQNTLDWCVMFLSILVTLTLVKMEVLALKYWEMLSAYAFLGTLELCVKSTLMLVTQILAKMVPLVQMVIKVLILPVLVSMDMQGQHVKLTFTSVCLDTVRMAELVLKDQAQKSAVTAL